MPPSCIISIFDFLLFVWKLLQPARRSGCYDMTDEMVQAYRDRYRVEQVESVIRRSSSLTLRIHLFIYPFHEFPQVCFHIILLLHAPPEVGRARKYGFGYLVQLPCDVSSHVDGDMVAGGRFGRTARS